MSRVDDIKTVLDRCPVRLMQNRDELAELLLIFPPSSPDPWNILEVGVANGGTLWTWMQFAPPKSHIVAIDAENSNNPLQKQWGETWLEWAKAADMALTVIFRLSQDSDVVDMVKMAFPTGFDFAFIDGGHAYDEAMTDYDSYRPMMKPGGMMAFHDVCFPRVPGANECARVWANVCVKENVTRIICPGTDPVNCIGVIGV